MVEQWLWVREVQGSMSVQGSKYEKFLKYENTVVQRKINKTCEIYISSAASMAAPAAPVSMEHSIQQAPSVTIMHKFDTYQSISASINHQSTSLVLPP